MGPPRISRRDQGEVIHIPVISEFRDMKNLTLRGWRQVSRLAICSFISLRNRSRRAVLTACCERRDRRLLPPAQPALWVSPRPPALPGLAGTAGLRSQVHLGSRCPRWHRSPGGPQGRRPARPSPRTLPSWGPGRGEPSLSLWLAWEMAAGSWKNCTWGTGPRGSGRREGQGRLRCVGGTCLLRPRRRAAEDPAGLRQTVRLGPPLACWPSLGSSLLGGCPPRTPASCPPWVEGQGQTWVLWAGAVPGAPRL